MQVSILFVVSSLAYVLAAPRIEFTLSESQTGFDFLPPIDYTEYCAKCEDSIPFTIHPYSCRIMMNCNRLTQKVTFSECPSEGTLFNAYFTCNKLDSHYGTKCLYDEQNNPCNSSRPIPSGKACNEYYVCDDSGVALKKMVCNDGEKFDYDSRGCIPDASCTSSGSSKTIPVRYNATCSEYAEDSSKYVLKEYYYSDNGPEMRMNTVDCPASMTFDQSLSGSEFCCSENKNVENGNCVPKNLVNASSTKDTWGQAMSGHDIPFSKIEGNATILRNSNSQFNGWAYFNGSTAFLAKKMSNNELRYYWNLRFQFQAGELSGNTVIVGMQRTGRDGNINSRVALIDNSACDIEGTYGCHIEVQDTNRGYVECFANNHEVRTETLDLTRVIAVELKREATLGTMVVKPDGSPEIVKSFTFKDGEVVEARDCPMTLGSGYKQRNFVGFMDNVMFYKNCQ